VDRGFDLLLSEGGTRGDALSDLQRDGLAADRVLDALGASAREVGGIVPDGAPSPSGLSVLAGLLSGPGGQDGIGGDARFYFPGGAALDGNGNLYIADSANNTIRKIVLATRQVSTIAGLLGETGSIDGVGTSARFYSPQGLAADQAGSLYIADSANHTIRKLDLATGQVATIAGTAGEPGNLDAMGKAARFQFPTGLALDGAGNLFVTTLDHTVRQIVLGTGRVTTVAGQSGTKGSLDGTGTEASFADPKGIVADGIGHLYVADTGNFTIRQIVLATRAVTTLAGLAGDNGLVEGIGSAARFGYTKGLALDGAGNLYVADLGMIHKIVLATAAVSNFPQLPDDVQPSYLVYDGEGALFATETRCHTVMRISLPSRGLTTVAGQRSTAGNKDGVGPEARFDGPSGLASDNQGGLFVANGFGDSIRRIDLASGRVTTLAGGSKGKADGVGSQASFYLPLALAYDGAGILYIADRNNATIRKLEVATGTVSTLAGDALSRGFANGQGSAARVGGPAGLALDNAGNLYVADERTIRKIALADVTVTTLAGTFDTWGSADGIGDQARFDAPEGLVWDGAGNLFVADTHNCTIRQVVVATGLTTTVAGSPGKCEGGDGRGSSAHFYGPVALAMDSAGRLLVADIFDNTVRRIDLSTRDVTTIVGKSGRWQTIPGPLPAAVAKPAGLAFLPSGELAISDQEEHAILLARF
jgi:sugar lactone lactonase YvrE